MRKGKIVEYLVVRDNVSEDFAAKVMQQLRAGYECRGKMKTERTGSQRFDYLQNMVKRAPLTT